jgi:ubiquinone/menaquinone biosynthesis C-methylase UbiE
MSTAQLSSSVHKPYGGLQMEGPIARWYAHITRQRPDHRQTAVAIAAQLPAGGDVLEVAPGPGYMAVELARLQPGAFRISGLDISHSFVRIATYNARSAGVEIDFRQGDVAHMPFAAESFDFVVSVAAFKNFPDPVRALDEIYRVLRPGGGASIFDMRKDAPPEAIEREIRDMHVAPPSAWLMKLIFRFGLVRAAYTPEALERIVERSRFGQAEIIVEGIGFELRLVK